MAQASSPPVFRLFIFLFFALNFFYLLTSSGRVRTIDEVTVDLQAESLATRGSSAVPQAISENLFYGKLDRQGRPQSPYGLGQAVLVLPWYEAGRILRNIVPGIPENARDIVLDAVLVTVSTLGYGTMAAHDGQEALATLGGPEPLDLLFTDVVMPRGINGIQLARRARELRPDLRILLTSGYGFQALAEGENDFPLLQKPYQRQALADTLRYVLDS